jgi:hypothetical protein
MEREKGTRPGKAEILAAINKQHLMFVGFSAADILGFGDLGKLTREQMHDLIHTKNLEAMKETGRTLDKASVKTKLLHKSDEKKQ